MSFARCHGAGSLGWMPGLYLWSGSLGRIPGLCWSFWLFPLAASGGHRDSGLVGSGPYIGNVGTYLWGAL